MPYTVEDTKQVQSMGPGGKLKTSYRVWIVTERGASGFVDVDSADWNADKLREILDDFAADLDLAYNLPE